MLPFSPSPLLLLPTLLLPLLSELPFPFSLLLFLHYCYHYCPVTIPTITSYVIAAASPPLLLLPDSEGGMFSDGWGLLLVVGTRIAVSWYYFDQGDTPQSVAVPDFDCCWMVEVDNYHLHPVVNHQSIKAADAVAAVVNSWCLVEKYQPISL